MLETNICLHPSGDIAQSVRVWATTRRPAAKIQVRISTNRRTYHLDVITLKGWTIAEDGSEALSQDSTLGALLTPDYWLDILEQRGLNNPGTIFG